MVSRPGVWRERMGEDHPHCYPAGSRNRQQKGMHTQKNEERYRMFV